MGASEVEETGLSGTVEERRVLATHGEQASQLFKLDHVRAAVIVDGLAELHVRWPAVPIVFCETRGLAEEWTYRYLAAAQTGAVTEHPALQHISPGNPVEWGTRRAATRHRRGPRPIAAESDPKSGKPGATHTASPEAETIEHTHTDNVCQVQFDRLEITEAAIQNQTQT
jgi:hypothetical protein